MSALKVAVFAAVLAVVSCDRPLYGKSYYRRPLSSYQVPSYSAGSYDDGYDSYEPSYSASSYKPSYTKGHDDYYSQPSNYHFDWAVKDSYSGNHYGHTENRDGKKTTGEYRTLLPDGRYQIVTYVADEYGYKANVHYEGEARYDDSYKTAAYSAPKPVYAAAPYKPYYATPSYYRR